MDNAYQDDREIRTETSEFFGENYMLNDPPVPYKRRNSNERPIPDYVLEDFRIGMEQYERGECTDVFEFLEELKRRNY